MAAVAIGSGAAARRDNNAPLRSEPFASRTFQWGHMHKTSDWSRSAARRPRGVGSNNLIVCICVRLALPQRTPPPPGALGTKNFARPLPFGRVQRGDLCPHAVEWELRGVNAQNMTGWHEQQSGSPRDGGPKSNRWGPFVRQEGENVRQGRACVLVSTHDAAGAAHAGTLSDGFTPLVRV